MVEAVSSTRMAKHQTRSDLKLCLPYLIKFWVGSLKWTESGVQSGQQSRRHEHISLSDKAYAISDKVDDVPDTDPLVSSRPSISARNITLKYRRQLHEVLIEWSNGGNRFIHGRWRQHECFARASDPSVHLGCRWTIWFKIEKQQAKSWRY